MGIVLHHLSLPVEILYSGSLRATFGGIITLMLVVVYQLG